MDKLFFYCNSELWTKLSWCNDNDDDGDLLRLYHLITTNMVSLNGARCTDFLFSS